MSEIAKSIASSQPQLKMRLVTAGMDTTPEKFIDNCIRNATVITIFVTIAATLVFLKQGITPLLLIILVPVIAAGMFFFQLNTPQARNRKQELEIDKDIVFAGRFLLIELSSGVPLYDALINVSKNYESIGKHIRKIIERVEVGVPIEIAIEEVIEITPSANFRKLLWQIMNSLRTGADVSRGLGAVVEQIAREQTIEVKNYAKKLNPLVMFYLIGAVIFPSLGITMLALVSSFLSLNLTLGMLIGIALFVGLIQLVFLTSIKQSRPGVGL
jgi:flagellar protein FlaJ